MNNDRWKLFEIIASFQFKKNIIKHTNNGDNMENRTRNIAIIILSILLVLVYVAAGTYAVVIDVIKNNGISEIVNEITVRDLVTTEDGKYNEYYYDVVRELNITEEEANLLINSAAINRELQDVLNNIVDYKINNGRKYTNNQLYNKIVTGVNETTDISDELKNNVIRKSEQYINDIVKYVYDIEVNVLNNG